MSRLRGNFYAQLFIILLKYLLGAAFVFASIVKLQGYRFTAFDGSNYPINSPFHFFETLYQSGLYWKFLGFSQFVSGALLLTQRWSKLGALMYFPVMLNIFIITISYDFKGTPVITGLMLMATVLILIWHWPLYRILFNKPYNLPIYSTLETQKFWEYAGWSIFIITVSMRIFGNYIFSWSIILFLIMIILIGLGLKKIKHHKKSLEASSNIQRA